MPLVLCRAMLRLKETAMRARLACALFVASVLACASLPAAAQVTRSTTQPQQSSLEPTPPAPRLLQSPESTEGSGARFFTFARDAQARVPQILRAPKLWLTEATVDLPATCAHILIYVAPPSADDRMMIKAPRDDRNPTPSFQGLQPCRRDFRPLFYAALGPPFRFLKPLRPDSQPQGSEKPSSLTQPK